MLAVAPPNIWRFRSRFGEFAKLSDADVQGMLDDAIEMLDQDKWNAHDYPLAVLYLAGLRRLRRRGDQRWRAWRRSHH